MIELALLLAAFLMLIAWPDRKGQSQNPHFEQLNARVPERHH